MSGKINLKIMDPIINSKNFINLFEKYHSLPYAHALYEEDILLPVRRLNKDAKQLKIIKTILVCNY